MFPAYHFWNFAKGFVAFIEMYATQYFNKFFFLTRSQTKFFYYKQLKCKVFKKSFHFV